MIRITGIPTTIHSVAPFVGCLISVLAVFVCYVPEVPLLFDAVQACLSPILLELPYLLMSELNTVSTLETRLDVESKPVYLVYALRLCTICEYLSRSLIDT